MGDVQLPGHAISEVELRALGFVPLTIEVIRTLAPDAAGCEWNTIGPVPEGPGHYLFTVEDGDKIRVAYVGLTEHLWMVRRDACPMAAVPGAASATVGPYMQESLGGASTSW